MDALCHSKPSHPQVSPYIIASICSVPFWGRSDESREGIILGLCVYLGRFHCGELFLWAGFYVHSKLRLRQQRWEFPADRKVKKALFLHQKLQRLTFDLTTKGNADSLTVIQVLVSHLGVAPKWPQLTKLKRLLKSTKEENGRILQTQMLRAPPADSAERLSANEIIIPKIVTFCKLPHLQNRSASSKKRTLQTINMHANVGK